MTACINALDGVNILTYSGWQLVFGKDPVIGSVPGAVQPEQRRGRGHVARRTSARNSWPSSRWSASAWRCCSRSPARSVLVAARSRAFVTAVFAAGAGALLVLDQLHVHDVLLAKIASSAGFERSRARRRVAASTSTREPGLVVALVILALAVLYNIAALIVDPGSGGCLLRSRATGSTLTRPALAPTHS